MNEKLFDVKAYLESVDSTDATIAVITEALAETASLVSLITSATTDQLSKLSVYHCTLQQELNALRNRSHEKD